MGQVLLSQSGRGNGLSRAFDIPTNILSGDLLSRDSNARVCFTSQQFSGKLQAFLINYVLSVSGYYSVFK